MLFKELVSSNSTFIFNTHSMSGETLLSVKVNDINDFEREVSVLRDNYCVLKMKMPSYDKFLNTLNALAYKLVVIGYYIKEVCINTGSYDMRLKSKWNGHIVFMDEFTDRFTEENMKITGNEGILVSTRSEIDMLWVDTIRVVFSDDRKTMSLTNSDGLVSVYSYKDKLDMKVIGDILTRAVINRGYVPKLLYLMINGELNSFVITSNEEYALVIHT